MNTSDNRRWLRVMMLFGTVYVVVGITFGELARWSASNETQVMWRWAAWFASAVAFAFHIGYEHFRLRTPPRSAAVHSSAAVAMGAFGLAVAANVHALMVGSGNHGLLAIALVVWPAFIAVPAFLVALAVAAGLARWPKD